jgi:hypothetical protein
MSMYPKWCMVSGCVYDRLLDGGAMSLQLSCIAIYSGATTQVEAVAEVEVTSAFGPGYDQRSLTRCATCLHDTHTHMHILYPSAVSEQVSCFT